VTRPVIAIVGASGSVGSGALACLIHDAQRYKLRAAYHTRSPQSSDKHDSVCWSRVNVYDDSSLDPFCSGCTVVLNTAGPSSQIGDRVARAADRAGADYVDAFGGRLLSDLFQANPLSMNRRVIHSAGIYPGLSELLPRWLARTHFDKVQTLRGWSGGREACSPAAALDVLASTHHGFGRAGALWEDGNRITNAMAAHTDADLPGFPGHVYVQPFLSEELERLIRDLDLRDVRWGNVMASTHALEVIARWSSRLGIHDGAEHTQAYRQLQQQAVNDLVETARMDLVGQTPYYRLLIDMEGTASGVPKRLRAVLKARDSYHVSGAVAAHAATVLVTNPPPPGTYRADSILDWESLLRTLQHNRCIDDFTLASLGVSGCDDRPNRIEEGAL